MDVCHIVKVILIGLVSTPYTVTLIIGFGHLNTGLERWIWYNNDRL